MAFGTLTRSLSGAPTLKLKLTGKAKHRLKTARAVKLSLRAVATEAAGNGGPLTVRSLTVKKAAPTTGHASTLVQIAERRLTAPNPAA